MQPKTEIHQLLRDFRDLTQAQLCSLVSQRGARVYVGRPATLNADDLARRSRGEADEADGDAAQRLTKTTASYAITVEFESPEAADKARGSFAELVGILDEMFSNDLEPAEE